MYKKIVGQFIPRNPFDANKFLLEGKRLRKHIKTFLGVPWSPSFTEDTNTNDEEYISESTEDLQNLLQQADSNFCIIKFTYIQENVIIEEQEPTNLNTSRKVFVSFQFTCRIRWSNCPHVHGSIYLRIFQSQFKISLEIHFHMINLLLQIVVLSFPVLSIQILSLSRTLKKRMEL